MKKLITIILGIVLLLPCLLVLNDNENVALNVAGLLYAIALTLAIKYSNDFKSFRARIKMLVERMDKGD